MSYTRKEISKHNTCNDCWIIIDSNVYNLTTFLNDHPGGRKAIELYAGQDATDEFDMLHERRVIVKYASHCFIGVVKDV